MTNYIIGSDIIGADPLTPSVAAWAQRPIADDPGAEKFRQEFLASQRAQQAKDALNAAHPKWTGAELKAMDQRAVKAMTAIMIGGAVGGVVGGAFGAWAWSAHRIWGFILASAFVGAPAGAGIGFAIGAREMSK